MNKLCVFVCSLQLAWLLPLSCRMCSFIIAEEADEALALTTADPYVPAEPLAGTIKLVGCDSLQQVASLWELGFNNLHPDARVEIVCGETIPQKKGGKEWFEPFESTSNLVGLAVEELTLDPAQLPTKAAGDRRFTTIVVGLDILAVLVHPDNPLESLNWDATTTPPLFAHHDALATTWNQVNDMAALAGVPLRVHGPDAKLSKFRFLQQLLQGSADEKTTIVPHPSVQTMLSAVQQDPGGVTFYSTSRGRPSALKVLPLKTGEGASIDPFAANAPVANYPLARPLTLTVAADAREPLVDEFLHYVLSRAGQLDLIKDGFYPLTREQLDVQETRLNWETLK